jgi:transposase
MTRKNPYANRARIFTWQLPQLVRYFALDLTASPMALLTGLNRKTVNRYVGAFRARIAEFCEAQSPFVGEVEVDESYFDARRIKGERGRSAYGKTIVFGLFQRQGQVYTELVSDCGKPALQAIIPSIRSITSQGLTSL